MIEIPRRVSLVNDVELLSLFFGESRSGFRMGEGWMGQLLQMPISERACWGIGNLTLNCSNESINRLDNMLFKLLIYLTRSRSETLENTANSCEEPHIARELSRLRDK